MAINRNILFLVLGALVVVVGVLSYRLYQEEKKPDGVEISIGSKGVSVKGN